MRACYRRVFVYPFSFVVLFLLRFQSPDIWGAVVYWLSKTAALCPMMIAHVLICTVLFRLYMHLIYMHLPMFQKADLLTGWHSHGCPYCSEKLVTLGITIKSTTAPRQVTLIDNMCDSRVCTPLIKRWSNFHVKSYRTVQMWLRTSEIFHHVHILYHGNYITMRAFVMYKNTRLPYKIQFGYQRSFACAMQMFHYVHMLYYRNSITMTS